MPSRPQMIPPVGKSGPGTISSNSASVHFGIVDHLDDRVADLAQVVRQQVARHADGDAGRAVDQQIGELARQDGRLHAGGRRSWAEIDRVETSDPASISMAGGGHAGFGVPHGGGGIAVGAAEVSLPIDQRVAQVPVLGRGGPASDRRPVRRAGDSCRWCRRRSWRTCSAWSAAPGSGRSSPREFAAAIGLSPSRTSGSARSMMVLIAYVR